MILDGLFAFGVANIDSLPKESVPEVVFAGRSNCGKSTMINAVFKRKKLARVSSNPGCTRQINFYSANSGRFVVVDLPGYGYAKVSKKKIAEYAELINFYFLNRSVLRAVFVLMDSKVGMKDSDFQFMEWLDYNNIKFVLVFTKVDKVTVGHVNYVANLAIDKLNLVSRNSISMSDIHCVSSKTGKGISKFTSDMLKLSS